MSNASISLRIKFGDVVYHDHDYESPVTKEKFRKDFFDRQVISQNALSISSSMETRKAVVILGERRSGKTSVLKMLIDKINDDPKYTSVEIGWPAIHSQKDLMLEMLVRLYNALGLDDDQIWNAILQVSTVAGFDEIVSRISRPYPDKVFIFGIDEFDSILIEQISDLQERQSVAGFVCKLIEDSTLPIKLILSSAKDLGNIDVIQASRLSSKIELLRIGPFSREDLFEMIKELCGEDKKLDEKELAAISALSGNWLYFAKAILYYLLKMEEENDQLEKATLKAIKRVSGVLENIYEFHWDELSRTIIIMMVLRDGVLAKDEVKSVGVEFQNAADDLVKRGYVLLVNDTYCFRVTLISKWLKGWSRFEEQSLKYLQRWERSRNPWSSGDENSIEVTPDDLRKY